jgi:hypothetical protein
MNTSSKFFALAFTAIAAVSGAAQADAFYKDAPNGEITYVAPFHSTRSRADVKAEAVTAAYEPLNGELGQVYAAVPVRSSLSRAEVKSATVLAMKAHTINTGEASF